MSAFLRDLKFSILLGAIAGLMTGTLALYIDSPLSNTLNISTDMILRAARSAFGISIARSLSSPEGLLLLFAASFVMISLIIFLATLLIGRAIHVVKIRLSPRVLLAWLFIAFVLLLYLIIWFHITRFLTYDEVITRRGLRILIPSCMITAVLVLILVALFRVLLRPVGKRAWRFSLICIETLVVIVLAVLIGTVALDSTGRIKSSFTVEDTGLRVMIVGIDAASSSLIEQLRAESGLANMSFIMENGSWGKLRSSTPLKSPLIWTTIATGCTYEEHGISDYMVRIPGKAATVPVTSLNRKKAALWNIVGSHERVGVINWWATWPAEVVNGFLVSGRFNLQGVHHKCYPDELSARVNSMIRSSPAEYDLSSFTRYQPDKFFDPVLGSLETHSVDDFLWNTLNKEVRNDNLVFSVARELDQEQRPRLFCVYSFGIDTIQHHFFKYHPESASFPFSLLLARKDTTFTGKVIDAYYEFTDSHLEDFVDQIGDSTVLVVVSDHGAGPRCRQVTALDFNRYFELKGWLRRTEDGGIDSEHSLVYSAGSLLKESTRKLYFGDRVASDDDSLSLFRNMLLKDLGSLRTRRGEQLVRRVVEKNDPEGGIIISIDKWLSADDSVSISGELKSIREIAIPMMDVFSGEHRINGIVMMAGGPVKRNYLIHGASIFDIAPTVLYLLGYPVANDMVGRVLTEAISRDFTERHPVRTIPTYDGIVEKTYKSTHKDEGADEAVMERLRALGYID